MIRKTELYVEYETKSLDDFVEDLKRLETKTARRIVKKAAQQGSNFVGKSIRSHAPKRSGQLKKGFKKKQEKAKNKNKIVFQYAMDSSKNDIFQKPIKNVGKYGGKGKHGYYPASVEYGFLTAAKSGGYTYTPGKQKFPSRKVEGSHFVRNAVNDAVAGSVERIMIATISQELDKEWKR